MAECQVKSADREQIQLDSRPLPTRAVSDGASRNKPNLSHLLMGAGMAQQRAVQIRPATELCSLDLGPPCSCSALPSCRKGACGESMERLRVAGGNRKPGEPGPGFLEVMVGNKGCQGCSFCVNSVMGPCLCNSCVSSGLFWKRMSAPAPVMRLPNSAGEGWCVQLPRICPTSALSIHALYKLLCFKAVIMVIDPIAV